MRRKILYATAGLLLLLFAAFMLRRQLLVPVLRSQLKEYFAQAFDAEISVDKIDGNMLDRVKISGIRVTGRPGRLLSRLQGGQVTVDFRPIGLLVGEADAIERLTVDCEELVLDMAGNLPPGEGGSASTELRVADLHGLLPKGARIRVDSLILRHANHERRAPFELVLGRLAPTREVDVRHGSSHLQLRLAEGGQDLGGSVEVADTGGLLRACGLDNDLASGQLRAKFALGPGQLQVPEVIVDVPGLQLTCTDLTVPFTSNALDQARGRLALDIVDLERQVGRMKVLPKEVRELLPSRGQVRAHVANGKLVVADGELAGNGLSIQLRKGELSLTRELARMSGTIGFTVVAASPVVIPLPDGRRLGIYGRVDCEIRGSVAEPVVRADPIVADLRMLGEELGLVTVRGRGSLGAGHASAELRGKLDPRWLTLAGLVPPRGGPMGFEIRGRSTLGAGLSVGEARVLVPELRLDGGGRSWRLALDVARDQDGALRLPQLLLAGEGSLRIQGRRTADGVLEGEMRLEELKVAQLAALVGVEDLRGAVSGLARVKGSAVVVDLTGSVEGLVARLPAAVAERLPMGRYELRLAGTAGPTGCQVEELRLSAGANELQAEAQGYLPLCWSEGGLAVVPGAVRPDSRWLHGKAEGMAPDPLMDRGQIRHQLVVALDAQGLKIQKLQVESAAGAARVEGNVKVGAESLLDLGRVARQAPLNMTVELQRFRLERLPARWRDPFSVAGLVSGRLQVVGPAAKPRVKGNLEGKDLSLRHPQAPALESGEAYIEVHPNEILVKRLTAQVAGTPLKLGGRVGVGAEDFWLAFERPEVSLVGELRLQDVPLALLSPAGVGLEEVGGLLSGRLQLGGTVEDPRPTVELSMRKGVARAVGRPPLHELEIDIAVTGHAVNVSRCGGMVGTTPFSASGELESPAVSLWRLWSGHDAPVRARLQVQNLTLDALPRAWTGLDDLRGRICGTVRLAGSFRRPEPEGNVQLTAGSVKLPRVPRLSDLQGSLEVSATAATLEARGTVGAGPLRLEARMDAGKGRVLEAAETSKITATLVGRDLLLARGPGMRVRADVNLAVAGSPKDMTVDGRLDITSAKFQRRLSLLPDPRLEGGTALTRLGPLALGPPLGERLRFRVDVATKKPAIVRTHVLDADLDAALKLIGPGNALQLQGAVSARSGILRFPGSSMQLETARVLFDPRHPDQPELMVNASGRRYGFETRLVAKGRPGDIEVEMSSVPQLSAKEVMVLITTGVPPDRLASRETRANVGLVGSYVLGELVGSFFASESLEAGESLAERFTFEFGTEVSRHGKETWAVEYDLSHLGLENFAARVEQDIYEDQSVNLIYKIRF